MKMRYPVLPKLLLWLYSIKVIECSLHFLTEPTSRLVKMSDSRAVFRCEAAPPSSEIRWLHNGHPINHNRWIKVAGNKLTILMSKMENSSSSSYLQGELSFQCEIRHKGKVLVSAPAKLVIAKLEQFRPQHDVHMSVIVGNTVVIPCDPPYSVPTVVTEFLFNDTVINRSTDNKLLMASGDLQILRADLEDAGQYTCVAYNPFLAVKVTAKHRVFLHVEAASEEKPVTIIKSPLSKISAALGSNITLECAASGSPAPTVVWKRRSGKLPAHRYHQIGGNLQLISIKREDEGTYFCEAISPISDLEVRSTALEIQESPHITKPLKNINVEEGENFTLNCHARGHPRPILKWLHNGKELVSDHRKSHLAVTNVTHKNSGVYQCFASNALGTTYDSAVITVASNSSVDIDYRDDYDDYSTHDSHIPHHKREKWSFNHNSDEEDEFDSGRDLPRNRNKKRHKKKHSKVKLIPPSKPELTRLSNTSVMVRWTVENGGLPINFFKVQYKEVGKRRSDWMTIDEDIAAHIHAYAVTNLRTGGAFRFRIAAVYSNNDNKAGPISNKFVLYKDPPMEKPSTAPTITFAEAASPSAITLHWEYNDVDSIQIDGFFIHYRATHTAGKYLKVTVLGSNTRSHIISHLLPDTGYDMKMQCFNMAGTSDFSNIYTSKTKAVAAVLRNRKGDHPDDEQEMFATEPIHSKGMENPTMYIVLGSVFGGLFIVIIIAACLILRPKNKRQRKRENGDHKVGNGHCNGNGYLPANKHQININVNPLSHLDVDSSDKFEELEDLASNNNEIIRLQTFNTNADSRDDAQRDSIISENNKTNSVISNYQESSLNQPTEL